MAQLQCLNWLFGRGLSMACGLPWSVPAEWQTQQRDEKIERIKNTLRNEMEKPTVSSEVIQRFLCVLETHIAPGWRNRFITTNWDYLLQREILSLNLETRPRWMASGHVFHLNGTVEELEDNSYRSKFVLEEDPAEDRCFTPEANRAYSQMVWDRTFVVVGMSFECETDKFLLSSLNQVEDYLPIGESVWIIVNRNQNALNRSCARIEKALPHAKVKRVCTDFNSWLKCGLVELQECGAITFQKNSKWRSSVCARKAAIGFRSIKIKFWK